MTIIRCYKKTGYEKLHLPKKEIKGTIIAFIQHNKYASMPNFISIIVVISFIPGISYLLKHPF